MPTKPRPELQGLLPYFREWVEKTLFGEVWERPQLSKRDRSLITIAILTSHYYDMNLADHIVRGLDNGLTPDEIFEVITHTAFYSGAPVAFQMARIARDTIAEYEKENGTKAKPAKKTRGRAPTARKAAKK